MRVTELDISEQAIEDFLAGDDGEPVVLVNLVRIRSGGEDAYRRYGEVVGPLLARVGAEIVYSGSWRGALIGSDRWDRAVVARYPRRSALAELVRDPEFQAATPLRHDAVEAGLLYAFA
jgi:uncharacterized protein (DUF1330 family)